MVEGKVEAEPRRRVRSAVRLATADPRAHARDRDLTPASMRFVGTGKVGEVSGFVRRCPKRVIARKVIGRVWGQRLFYELRCQLGELPAVRSARVPVRMMPAGRTLETALAAEGDLATGMDYLQVVYLNRFLCAGVQEPFLAQSADGKPVYCQWLIRPRDHGRLQKAMPGRYRDVAEGEVLLEGAYTFLALRGVGAMADGMSQLLRTAHAEGYAYATTYVAADNVAALRGCYHVGFHLVHAHVATHRFGRRREDIAGGVAAREGWARATVVPR
jgi:hypothetical protein